MTTRIPSLVSAVLLILPGCGGSEPRSPEKIPCTNCGSTVDAASSSTSTGGASSSSMAATTSTSTGSGGGGAGPCVPAPVAAQPPPPTTGPGSAVYPHASARVTQGSYVDKRFWIFEPADPQPAEAPVLLFLHGAGLGSSQDDYGALLTHIARKGYTVVYPQYSVFPLPNLIPNWLPNAAFAARQALDALESESGRVRPSGWAVAGHSAGGLLAIQLALDPAAYDLPAPKVLLLPEHAQSDTSTWVASVLENEGAEPFTIDIVQQTAAALEASYGFDNLDAIPSSTLAVMVAGYENWMRAGADGTLHPQLSWERDWSMLGHLAERSFVVLPSDEHGDPAIMATHASMMQPIDALDYYGWYRLMVAGLDHGFRGIHGEYVLGGSLAEDMGAWTDCVAVAPAMVNPFP